MYGSCVWVYACISQELVCGHVHMNTTMCLCKGVCIYDMGISEHVDHVCNPIHLTLL